MELGMGQIIIITEMVTTALISLGRIGTLEVSHGLNVTLFLMTEAWMAIS